MSLTGFISGVDWAAVITAFATLIGTLGTIFGGVQWKGRREAELERDCIDYDLQQTQAFFDPEDTEVMTPPEGTPARSWKMSESTRFTLKANCSTPEDKLSVIQQVDEAEKAGYVDYTVVFSNGFAKISYGLIAEISKHG